MITFCCRFLVWVGAFALLSPSEAKGCVVTTWGDTISHVGEASPQAKHKHASNRVGYKYSYFGVFWIDLWTHGGTYCVYEGKSYNEIAPGEAALLLGKNDAEMSTPFLYRVPLGWIIFGPLIVIGIICWALETTSAKEGTPLFQDARYRKALEILHEQYAKQPATPPVQATETQSTSEDDIRVRVAFEAGVQHLIENGIPRDEAEQNLGAMIQALPQPDAAPGGSGSAQVMSATPHPPGE